MEILEKALNFFFPQTCGICEKICDDAICNKCKKELDKIIFPSRKCFIELKGNYYDEHMHIFKYNGMIKEKIVKYKFKDRAYLSKFFAEIIYSNKKVMKYIYSYDYIIPIPLSKIRKRLRGYNQTYLILKELKKRDINIKLETDILYKDQNIKPQSTLNEIERKINIKNAYSVKNIEKIKNKKILLFDDVFTTGSTTNECSRLLKENGAKKVGVLTIAKD